MTTKEKLKKARSIILDKARNAHQFNDAWVVATLPYVTQNLDNAIKLIETHHDEDETHAASILTVLVMAERIIKAVEDADSSIWAKV